MVIDFAKAPLSDESGLVNWISLSILKFAEQASIIYNLLPVVDNFGKDEESN